MVIPIEHSWFLFPPMEKAPAVEFERVEPKPRADMSSRINVHAQEVEHKLVD